MSEVWPSVKFYKFVASVSSVSKITDYNKTMQVRLCDQDPVILYSKYFCNCRNRNHYFTVNRTLLKSRFNVFTVSGLLSTIQSVLFYRLVMKLISPFRGVLLQRRKFFLYEDAEITCGTRTNVGNALQWLRLF